MVKLRRHIETKIEDGKELTRVHIKDKVVELWKSDYQLLTDELRVNPNWVLANGRDIALALAITNSKLTIARLLLDADAGQTVRYKDANPLNLRRENLLLIEGDKRGGKRRDRNFIRYALSHATA